MNCERCQGLFLADRYNVLAGVDLREYVMWRCVNCGNIRDTQIVMHRALQKHHLPIAASANDAVVQLPGTAVARG
ncbi:MAG: hypothetical protein ABI945_11190 [Nitrospirales bacterium]